jgi:hypothetical protein
MSEKRKAQELYVPDYEYSESEFEDLLSRKIHSPQNVDTTLSVVKALQEQYNVEEAPKAKRRFFEETVSSEIEEGIEEINLQKFLTSLKAAIQEGSLSSDKCMSMICKFLMKVFIETDPEHMDAVFSHRHYVRLIKTKINGRKTVDQFIECLNEDFLFEKLLRDVCIDTNGSPEELQALEASNQRVIYLNWKCEAVIDALLKTGIISVAPDL